MGLFEQLAIEDSIEIDTTLEKIWDFFLDLEQNYTIWHPQDHVLFKWTQGKPMEEGSSFYAEQYVMGKIKKYKGTCADVIPYRRFAFKFAFPISLVSPRAEWRIEPKGTYCLFTAVTYMRWGRLFQKLFKKEMEKLSKAHDKHVGAEGENLKNILEATRTSKPSPDRPEPL